MNEQQQQVPHIDSKVVMLPTFEPTDIFMSLGRLHHRTGIEDPEFYGQSFTPQHLYFISPIEPIRGRDWCLYEIDGNISVRRCLEVRDGVAHFKGEATPARRIITKIVASTDVTLNIPKISKEWIRNKYVPSKGQIENVRLVTTDYRESTPEFLTGSLKLKDNEVVIFDEQKDTQRFYCSDESRSGNSIDRCDMQCDRCDFEQLKTTESVIPKQEPLSIAAEMANEWSAGAYGNDVIDIYKVVKKVAELAGKDNFILANQRFDIAKYVISMYELGKSHATNLTEHFMYCKSEIERGEEGRCEQQCDRCKEYYAPLEKEHASDKIGNSEAHQLLQRAFTLFHSLKFPIGTAITYSDLYQDMERYFAQHTK